MNRDPGLLHRFPVRLAVVAGFSALAAAGCSGGKSHTASEHSPQATTSASPTNSEGQGMPVAATLYPDLSWYLKDSTTCLNGGPRPCGVRLRSFPEVSDTNVVNQASPADNVAYPEEAFDGQPATRLDGICEVEAATVHSASPPNKYATSKWYVVRIALSHILNPAIKADAESTDPSFHVRDGKADVFMSAAWARGHGNIKLPTFTSIEFAQNRD